MSRLRLYTVSILVVVYVIALGICDCFEMARSQSLRTNRVDQRKSSDKKVLAIELISKKNISAKNYPQKIQFEFKFSNTSNKPIESFMGIASIIGIFRKQRIRMTNGVVKIKDIHTKLVGVNVEGKKIPALSHVTISESIETFGSSSVLKNLEIGDLEVEWEQEHIQFEE